MYMYTVYVYIIHTFSPYTRYRQADAAIQTCDTACLSSYLLGVSDPVDDRGNDMRTPDLTLALGARARYDLLLFEGQGHSDVAGASLAERRRGILRQVGSGHEACNIALL